MITNFDRLNGLRTEAARFGAGSKAWIEFATVMFDSFPALYQTASSMNNEMHEIRTRTKSLQNALCDLVAQIELHTDCMDGHIDRSALAGQIDAAEKLVGAWPEFPLSGVVDNPVTAGIDRTTDGAIGQP